MYICIHIYLYISISLCLCIYIYIYICIHRQRGRLHNHIGRSRTDEGITASAHETMTSSRRRGAWARQPAVEMKQAPLSVFAHKLPD